MAKFEISLPNPNCSGQWLPTETFDTREAAIFHAKKLWGADNEGRVSIVNELPSDEDE